ncbi:uncharacterized protein LOC110711290 [Chenopodium quinoa]|uniref:uncharacterized protein LOC110711290 n=1 Tax=Chenopodium quinoa TaxID=63459 RepID=UPI000B770C30|nr:uncharacterized protein LOC110711290 [Chenopodium quinoa]
MKGLFVWYYASANVLRREFKHGGLVLDCCFHDDTSVFSARGDSTVRRKTHGMGVARKLKSYRRRQRWADKSYKKSHLGNECKKPFVGSSHAKGIVLEKICLRWKCECWNVGGKFQLHKTSGIRSKPQVLSVWMYRRLLHCSLLISETDDLSMSKLQQLGRPVCCNIR